MAKYGESGILLANKSRSNQIVVYINLIQFYIWLNFHVNWDK